jgi:glyoxylase-like metal-dependent hydrolase (beta-lactamase superfamily II)
MRVHHLNCATMCPLSARLINGRGGLLTRARMVCHCLLVETDDGLVLVDTGLGLKDIADPNRQLGRSFVSVIHPRLDPDESAVHQVSRLGFQPQDVRHIIVTHLDLDHAGGLPDFPDAQVHVFAAEHEAAMARRTLNERMRYRPGQWAHHPLWTLHSLAGERWFGFDCVQTLNNNPDLLLVPVQGHSRGHCAVAVRTPETWLLHCGDAYYFHGQMDRGNPSCPLGLKIFQRLQRIDRMYGDLLVHNQERLRALARERTSELQMFCCHDAVELDRYHEKHV